LILFWSLSSCDNSLHLDNFDKKTWVEDKNGCKNMRLSYLESIEKQKDKLKNLSQKEIVSIFGNPDAQDLMKRNAKTFTYFLSKGSQCQKGQKEGLALIIRFGALDYVSEIQRNRYE
ncbi:MAG: hypothetical protein SFU27_02385, partial [Thermonemataceae bacterium]|nr:hypothetical protein [Thermonemataceae bacterium]